MFAPACPVFCRVYTPDHSYVTIRSRLSCRVGEILALVKEKLQYSEDQPVLPGNLILVAVTSAGGQETLYSVADLCCVLFSYINKENLQLKTTINQLY